MYRTGSRSLSRAVARSPGRTRPAAPRLGGGWFGRAGCYCERPLASRQGSGGAGHRVAMDRGLREMASDAAGDSQAAASAIPSQQRNTPGGREDPRPGQDQSQAANAAWRRQGGNQSARPWWPGSSFLFLARDPCLRQRRLPDAGLATHHQRAAVLDPSTRSSSTRAHTRNPITQPREARSSATMIIRPRQPSRAA
jgi:hypothetical protein